MTPPTKVGNLVPTQSAQSVGTRLPTFVGHVKAYWRAEPREAFYPQMTQIAQMKRGSDPRRLDSRRLCPKFMKTPRS